MRPENINDKINMLLDYKDLLTFYQMEDEIKDPDEKRLVLDQIDSEIDFYLQLTLNEGAKLPLLN
jgi:ADP-dependent phosphofructokinase/glucokinase